MDFHLPPGSWFASSTEERCHVCAAAARRLDPDYRRLTAELARDLLAVSRFEELGRLAVAAISDSAQFARASIVVPHAGGVWRVLVNSDAEVSHDLLVADERYPELLIIRRTGHPFLSPNIPESPGLEDQSSAFAAAAIQGLAAFPVWLQPGSADPVILRIASAHPLQEQELVLGVAVSHLLLHRLLNLPVEEAFRRVSGSSTAPPPERRPISINHVPMSAVIVDQQGRIVAANGRAEWVTRSLPAPTQSPIPLAFDPPRPWEREGAHWEATLDIGPGPVALRGWSRQLPDGLVLLLLEPHPDAHRRDRERQIQKSLALKVRELAEANRRLEEYASLRSRFVTDAAHELKTPLAILCSYLETLETDLSSGLNPEQQDFLRAATVGAHRLQSLVEALLDLAALEGGHAALRMEPVTAMDLVHRVVTEMLPRAGQSDVSLTVLPSAPMVLRADSERLAQVIRNLVDNGIKYSRREGTVSVSSHLAAERGVILVEDNGIGVPEHVLPNIFDEFFRGSGHDRASGAGLGLAIVRRLVQAMGGRVWAESRESQGSRFSVELPLWAGEP